MEILNGINGVGQGLGIEIVHCDPLEELISWTLEQKYNKSLNYSVCAGCVTQSHRINY